MANIKKKTKGSGVFSVIIEIITIIVFLAVLFTFVKGRLSAPESTSAVIPTQQPESTPSSTPEPTEEPEIPVTVRISEVMSSNKATLADSCGEFPDWIELYNYGDSEAQLDGCVLRCGADEWVITGISIPRDRYTVIFCGSAEGADLTVSSQGDTISLTSSRGTPIDEVSVPVSESDRSFVRCEDGSLETTVWPSPGYENSTEGYAAFQSSMTGRVGLVINEVMVYNNWYQRTSNGYFDVVELKNTSNETIQLSDYYLSDKGSERAMYRLPERTLSAGATYVVQCTGDETLGFEGAAPFALSALYDKLYLSNSSGELIDYVSLHDIPYEGSIGRMDSQGGFFYFTEPTIGSDNRNGKYSIADMPVNLSPDGVFEEVESVSVSLSGSGKVYYTVDGSIPTETSQLYTEPFEITESCVVKAINVLDGCIDSDVLNLTYFVNEGFSLPIVTLNCAKSDFTRVYNNPSADNEEPCTVTLYDGDEGFTIDCGFKLHGATSKFAQDKKSMKLTFRSRYDGELNYDLFGNGVTSFSSVILRAAQEDTYSTLIRDNLMHQLAKQSTESLSIQDYKYIILYVNGQYWGVYNIREAHSPTHFENHFGYTPGSVTQYQEAWPAEAPYSEAYYTAMSTDLSNAENYAKVAAVFDIDSIIEWSIIQAYSDNMDCNSPNMRFYVSTDDGIMHYALVDLDLGMFSYWEYFDVPFGSGYAYNNLAKALLRNGEFRTKFLEKASSMLNGALKDENALATMDSLKAQIYDEIPRDRERWGGSLYNWDNMYASMTGFLNGRARNTARALRNYISISDADFQKYFGNL